MDLELDKIKSVIKLQTFFKNTIYQFNKCIEKKNNIFQRINNLVSKTEYNYNNDIINQEKYTGYMQNMEILLQDFYKLPTIKKNSLNLELSYINILANLSFINKKLLKYEKKFGNSSLTNILSFITNWNSFFYTKSK